MRTLQGASKDERIAARYVPANAVAIVNTEAATVYYYDLAGKFYGIAYRGTSSKSEWHHSFRTEAARQDYADRFLASVKDAAERKAARSAAKKAWTNPLTVGTILYTSWGYDQTNVEFFVVTRVAGKRVWVAEIAADYEGTGYMSGKTWPAMPIKVVGEETMHIAQPCGDGGASVKISECRTAWVETGREHGTTSYA